MTEIVEQQPPGPVQAGDGLKKCIACHEPINQEAVVCFHCQTRQKRNVWMQIEKILKWIGSFAVIATLLGTLVTLYRGLNEVMKLTASASQRNAAIKDMQNSVDTLLLKLNDINSASILMKRILELDPTNKSVRNRQLDLAMVKVRQFMPAWQERDLGPLEALRAELLLGAGQKGQNGAKILAHIAWLNYVLNNYDKMRNLSEQKYFNLPEEKYFEQAKSMDPDEPYLYVLKGSWSMKGDAGEIEIDDYIKAINNAAKYKAENKITDNDISEINRIIWLHLGATRIPDRTKSEALMLANAYREMDWKLSKWRVEKALEYTWQMFRSANESKHIAAKLGLDNMNLTYEWLLEVLQQIRALSPLEKLEDQYARARLAEFKGDWDKALAELKKIRLAARALERRLRDDIGFHTRLRPLYENNQDLLRLLDIRVAWLGLDSSLLEADHFKQLTGSPGEGFLVDTVAADGPAARAGIRPHDVILKRE